MADILGTDGTDIVFGTRRSDEVVTLGGDDFVATGRGQDFVSGGEGEDILASGRSADVVKGGFGDDIINGGRGSDVMTGGHGDDEFIWAVTDVTNGATDVIVDFASVDKNGKGVDGISFLGAFGFNIQIDSIDVGDFGGEEMNGEDLRNNSTDDVVLTVSSTDFFGRVIATQEIVLLDAWRRDSIDALEDMFADLGFDGEIGEYVEAPTYDLV
ncbi:hypothetical protein JANAI62_27680 [Jannaschia pagri]|uniref:Hemolysin-type calcium-binding repeat-containing protein n=1 Tax=Jannaschia pagri TaxID=2829797 RepID=A0ABQ4NP23_9RHOB|nr:MULTISPECIES: hypothetical protein [unclassified Jannaschia]GIT92310.1 hypothetical protein JANAI61_27680 [Jannaschia sp. AI_61]GIT96145.1 hypothetical protein JANAI62_27680 [Jannaschia sp. AI_62]